MSKVDVKSGAYPNTPVREGGQENSPEAARDHEIPASLGIIYLALSNTYPDVLVPDTIGEQLAGDPTDRNAAARIASSQAAHTMIQSAVAMQQPEMS